MANPKDCRQRALRFAELAHDAETTQLKAVLLDMTKSWLRLAVELDRTHIVLDDDALGVRRTSEG